MVGCSDGTCEALCTHSHVRGCGAHWSGPVSLREAVTGHACGSAPHAPCKAPADACGPGWGLCLSHAAPGLDTLAFLSSIDAATCASPPGGFVAAMSHAPIGATTCPNPANHSRDNGCAPRGYGSEPLCCGTACGVPSCSTALWPGATRALFGPEAAGSCANVVTSRSDGMPRGVLCCRKGTAPQRQGVNVDIAVPHADKDVAPFGVLTWEGSSLSGMYQFLPQPADMTQWNGGLTGGPIALFDAPVDKNTPLTSVVLGPLDHFTTVVLSRVGPRMIGGVQGMVTQIEPNYTARIALTARVEGLTSGIMAFGSLLQRLHGTHDTKLRLDADPLSRQLHYVTDGGSLLNYCDYWPSCAKEPAGCTPQGRTLQAVHAYHRRLGLNVSVYHVDPYWFSHEANGGCGEGACAVNMSASPFHFPDGLASLGINMMLFVQCFVEPNVYNAEYTFVGQSVSAEDSARFFSDRFREFTSAGSVCSALTLDGVDKVHFSHMGRLNSTTMQEVYDKGLADAALAHGFPIRVDQESPSDILASVLFGARTVGFHP